MSLPDQYKTGIAYFMDFEIGVNSSTFIPRPETEILVEKTLDIIDLIHKKNKSKNKIDILDLCTGSGNIAISLTKYNEQSKIIALDISREALVKARENALKYGISDSIRFIQSDLFSGLNKRKALFDIIVSNPPYISNKDMAWIDDIVKTEPFIALYGGTDGLDYYRHIIKEAKYYLKKDGYILMEMGYDQSEAVTNMLIENGYSHIELYKDYSDINRIVKAGKNNV